MQKSQYKRIKRYMKQNEFQFSMKNWLWGKMCDGKERIYSPYTKDAFLKNITKAFEHCPSAILIVENIFANYETLHNAFVFYQIEQHFKENNMYE